MTFAWATDNEALRHLSTEIIQARFHRPVFSAVTTIRPFIPQRLPAAVSARRIIH
jgi:spermidine synthase